MQNDRHSAAPNTEHLTVMGEAKLEFVPDVVEISMSINRTDDTAALAKADVDTRAAKVIRVARDLGILTQDIRASDLAIAPHREYRNGEYHHKGFAAALLIQLKLRDLTRFNQLLSLLVDVPIDKIGRITTKLNDESSANQAAIAKAIEDAKAKAATIAAQFGVRLGGVYSVTALPKQHERFHAPVEAARGMGQDEATFEVGTITVDGRIEVTFYLAKPGP